MNGEIDPKVQAQIDAEIAKLHQHQQQLKQSPRDAEIHRLVHLYANSGMRDEIVSQDSIFLKTEDVYIGPKLHNPKDISTVEAVKQSWEDSQNRKMFTEHKETPHILHQRDMEAAKITEVAQHIADNPDYQRAERMMMSTQRAAEAISSKRHPAKHTLLQENADNLFNSHWNFIEKFAAEQGIPEADRGLLHRVLQETQGLAQKSVSHQKHAYTEVEGQTHVPAPTPQASRPSGHGIS